MRGAGREVALAEQSTAWELRKAWAAGREVRLTLTERCMVGTVVGRVSGVAVTGAFAVVDGWHVPCAMVRAIGKPTVEDRQRYLDRARTVECDSEEAA